MTFQEMNIQPSMFRDSHCSKTNKCAYIYSKLAVHIDDIMHSCINFDLEFFLDAGTA